VIQTTVATANPLGVKVIAGAGSNATAHAIELQLEAEDFGADASLQVVPYYNKPSQEGLFGHFMAIADAAHIPVVLYDVPGRAGVGLSVETVVRLAAHPNIVAIKVANGSLGFVGDVAGRCDLAILSGDDPLTLPMQALGAVGVISVLGNITPGDVAQQIAAGNRGDFAAARVIHERVLPLATGLLSLDGNPVPVKAAMSMLGRDSGVVRPPLAGASASVITTRAAPQSAAVVPARPRPQPSSTTSLPGHRRWSHSAAIQHGPAAMGSRIIQTRRFVCFV
jgi:4-hydroxy-tetrahydrodipicolinate synthase